MAKEKAALIKLVIVESPAKARKIGGYLGDDYVVEASVGHIRDLPQRAADILYNKKAARCFLVQRFIARHSNTANSNIMFNSSTKAQ